MSDEAKASPSRSGKKSQGNSARGKPAAESASHSKKGKTKESDKDNETQDKEGEKAIQEETEQVTVDGAPETGKVTKPTSEKKQNKEIKINTRKRKTKNTLS